MADTRTQNEVEDWADRTGCLSAVVSRSVESGFGYRLVRFDLDAVSADNRIVASISTSSGKTAGGKYPVGKCTSCGPTCSC